MTSSMLFCDKHNENWEPIGNLLRFLWTVFSKQFISVEEKLLTGLIYFTELHNISIPIQIVGLWNFLLLSTQRFLARTEKFYANPSFSVSFPCTWKAVDEIKFTFYRALRAYYLEFHCDFANSKKCGTFDLITREHILVRYSESETIDVCNSRRNLCASEYWKHLLTIYCDIAELQAAEQIRNKIRVKRARLTRWSLSHFSHLPLLRYSSTKSSFYGMKSLTKMDFVLVCSDMLEK